MRQDIPYSAEAEKSVLSAMLMDADALNTAVEKLNDQHFYRGDTRAVFRAICTIYERDTELDTTTLTDQLQSDDEYEDVGGAEFLSSLLNYVASAANIEHHIDILVEKERMRYLVRTGRKIIERASQAGSGEAEKVISEAESWIYKLSEDAVKEGPFRTQDFMEEVADDLRARVNRDEGAMGVPSGFGSLDDKIVGFEPGDFVIVAGRPSMGKTALALNIMEKMTLARVDQGKDPIPAVMFSLEMEKKKLVYRLISSYGSVNSLHLRTGDMTGEEMERVGEVMRTLNDVPIFIDDTGTLTPMQIRAKLRRIATNTDIGAIFVDYLQLMDASKEANSRQYEITHISRQLKSIAKEFDAPMIALSQLNRAVENRSPPRPVLSDLRESGSLEQDADLVVFLYRPEYYNEKQEDKPTGYTELIIGKQRNGPTDTVPLRFEDQFTRFEGLDVGM